MVAIWNSRAVRFRSRRVGPELITAGLSNSAAISPGSSRSAGGPATGGCGGAAGWVGKSPDGQLDVVPELLVQFLRGVGGPGASRIVKGGRMPSSTSGMGYCIKVPGC